MIPRLPASFLERPLAHRALHNVTDGRPENSRAAVRAAMAGHFGIEIDLQLSSDDQAMVFHDYDLTRLAEATGPIRQRSARELANIPLRGGDEGIPTLAEICSIVDGQVALLIELKDQDGAMGSNIGALETATAHVLRSYRGPVAVMSFNPNSTKLMAELLPDVPRGIVTCAYTAEEWPLSAAVRNRLRDIPDYDAVQASFISHDRRDLDRARVAELKTAGADVLCWTVRSVSEEVEARKVAQNVTFENYLPAD